MIRFLGMQGSNFQSFEMLVFTTGNVAYHVPPLNGYHTVRKFNTGIKLDTSKQIEVESFLSNFVPLTSVSTSSYKYDYHGEHAGTSDLPVLLSQVVTTLKAIDNDYEFYGVGVSINPKLINGTKPGSNVELKFGAGKQIGIPNEHSFAFENIFVINIHVEHLDDAKGADAYSDFESTITDINDRVGAVGNELMTMTPVSCMKGKMTWPYLNPTLDYWVDQCSLLEDMTGLVCKDCPNTFTFTKYEIANYLRNGWPYPVRCKKCIQAKNAKKKLMHIKT